MLYDLDPSSTFSPHRQGMELYTKKKQFPAFFFLSEHKLSSAKHSHCCGSVCSNYFRREQIRTILTLKHVSVSVAIVWFLLLKNFMVASRPISILHLPQRACWGNYLRYIIFATNVCFYTFTKSEELVRCRRNRATLKSKQRTERNPALFHWLLTQTWALHGGLLSFCLRETLAEVLWNGVTQLNDFCLENTELW